MNDEPRPTAITCGRCGEAVTTGRGEGYFIDIRAVADPFPPVFTEEELAVDAGPEISKLVRRLQAMSAEQLADEVYRRRLLCLCNACYAGWIADPFGAART